MNNKILIKLFGIMFLVALILPVLGNVRQVRASSKYYAHIEMETKENGYSELYESRDVTIESDGEYIVRLSGLGFSEYNMWDSTIESLKVATTIPYGSGNISDVTILIDGSVKPLTTFVTTTIDGKYIVVDFTNVSSEVTSLPTDEISVRITVSDIDNHGGLGEYVVFYNANGAIYKPENQYFNAGESFQLSYDYPEKPGDVFLGWSLESTSSEVDYSPGDEVTFYRNVSLYAVWENSYCTLIYDTQGGEMISQFQTCQMDRQALITTEIPVKKGYVFKGWSTNSNAQTASYQSGDTIVIKRTTTLYAVWGAISYRIVYNANGGKGKIKNANGSTNKEITLASSGFTKQYSLILDENHSKGKAKTKEYEASLLGWMTSANGTLKYRAGERVTDIADNDGDVIYLYAKWGECDVVLPEPKRTGYEFRGWSKSKKALTAEYEPGNKYLLDQDAKLYAVWEEIVSSDSNTIKNGTTIKTGVAKYVVKDKNKRIIYFDKPLNKAVKTITIPKSVRYQGISYMVKGMQSHAFYNCNRLKSINIQANISELPAYAFYNCTALTKVKLPGTTTKIGAMAFKNCKSLITFSIGKVSNIAGDAFAGCEKLHFSGAMNKNAEKYALNYGFYKLSDPRITKKQENGYIVIEWDKVKNAQGYEVYRKVGNEGYKKLTTGAAGNTSINIPVRGIQSGSYGIRIRAFYKTDDGETVYSSYSNEIAFTQ